MMSDWMPGLHRMEDDEAVIRKFNRVAARTGAMGSILHRKTFELRVHAVDAGHEFACADCVAQAEFLDGWVQAVDDWEKEQSWIMQCRAICDEMAPSSKEKLAALLIPLLEHLQESDAR